MAVHVLVYVKGGMGLVRLYNGVPVRWRASGLRSHGYIKWYKG